MNNNLNKIEKAGFVLLGLLLPVLAWVYICLTNSENSLQLIVNLHSKYYGLFFLDFFPLAICVISVVYINKLKVLNNKYVVENHGFKNKLLQNEAFAKKLGEGDYNFRISNDSNDSLANSLELLRTNLSLKNEQETNYVYISKGNEIISDLLRFQTNIDELAYNVLVKIIDYTQLIQGAFYIYNEDKKLIVNKATYAYNNKKYIDQEFRIGEGLIGQAAYEKNTIYRKEIPSDYVTITSGILGDKKPASILIIPLKNENKLYGIIELASIEDTIPDRIKILVEKLSEIITRTIFNLQVNASTVKHLTESQLLTEELKRNEERLQKNAIEMKIYQDKIEETNQNLEMQIMLVENSKQRLHSLLENASEVISIYNPDGTIIYESPSIKNILGYNAEEIIGTDGFARIIDSQSDRVQIIFAKLLKNPDEFQLFEFQYTKKNGQIVWLESIGRNLLKNRAIHGIIFNTRDISERKLAEKEQRKRGQMQALSENSPDMIIRLAPDGSFYYVNPIIEKYTLISPTKFFHKKIDDLLLENDLRIILHEVISNVRLNNEKYKAEYELNTDFDKRIMLINAIPENNENKELESILVVAHDNTELKKIEMEIRKKNKNITESINYAKRIQTSIIPTINHITKNLEKTFVFYKPKDVVSGDFPWFFCKGDNIYIAAVDCTGHGVPGALLTFIGYFLLNSIVDHSRDYDAGEVLLLLHNGVKLTLKQDGENTGANDGMDIALCKINLKSNKLQFAGAHRPLYLLRNGEIIEFKGDRKPIGGSYINKKCSENYTTHYIDFITKDKIFFYTDGFSDQFNYKCEKYSSSKIKNDIIQNAELSMSEYYDFFNQELNLWKSDCKQTDDILMIGIEF